MNKTITIEKFAATDLAELRKELKQSGLDSWQAAELISAFLSGRGYGVASNDLRSATTRIDTFACSIQHMQEELEKVAFFM
ncbi:hypothetical protein [Granulicella arctica]|uniref:Uncharacterized protein n=1 Tax=Granulicella arctica TaxID=940613 RepID=A0A7Y9PE41_9BACT|nr:hypothetical protein [Granulicella arctica]NYF78248.1 hypothetical protein [Granulicella arctica]